MNLFCAGSCVALISVHKYMNSILGLKSIVRPKKPEYEHGKPWSTLQLYNHRSAWSKCCRRYNRSAYHKWSCNRTLKKALESQPVLKGELILHSDQGSQFTSKAFVEFCESVHVTQSMSKAGCPYDNSPMESFYGTFKSEFIRQNRFETDQELNESTLDYVYGYYNHIRPHSSNGYMTPFEKRYSNQWFFSVWMLQKCLTISVYGKSR